MKFDIQKNDPLSKARAGVLETANQTFETPIFMPVGTLGTVKGMEQGNLKEKIDAPIILGNTYHLFLRPGTEILHKAGGLKKFMNWDRALLTDSGGFQVYSLSAQRKLAEQGVTFKSHIDGSKHFFSPEKVVEIQRIIGSDIMMVLDECTPWPCEYEYAKQSMGLTHRWAKRSKDKFSETEALYGYEQTLFPIVQGSTFKDLRLESAKTIADLDFEGNAIGGLSVGEPAAEMYEMTQLVTEQLPEHKPRYLMGVGTPENILECISLGIDMFDCVMPTRNARHGLIFTRQGIRNLKNAKYKDCFESPDPESDDPIDKENSLAYLHHLFRSSEMLGLILATLHNLSFYLWLVREARKHIIEGDFYQWKTEMVKKVSQKI